MTGFTSRIKVEYIKLARGLIRSTGQQRLRPQCQVNPDAPDGPKGSSQQQADAQQQAAQRVGAAMAAQANADSQPPMAQANLTAQVNGFGTGQGSAPSSDTPAGTIDLGTVTVYAHAPPVAAATVVAGAGAATPEAVLPEIGDAVLTGLTYLGRGLLTLGEGVVGGVVLPAAALVGGVLWPSSLGSDDTLTGQAGTGSAGAAQSDPPDSNTPPPPPAVSPSGQTGSPTGPEDPDGNSTVASATRLTNNQVTLSASSGSAQNGGSLSIEAGSYSESELRVAQYLADQGNDVALRQPVGTQAGGGTSDMLVNGVRYDTYTPITNSVNRIVSQVASKNSQAEVVVVDLSQANVAADQLTNILARVKSAGATNIQNVIVLPK